MCTMPSMPPSSEMNSPNSVIFLISPSIMSPMGWFCEKISHGFGVHCRSPSEIRRLSSFTSSTMTSTSWLVESSLPGGSPFLIQLISET